MIQLLWLVAVKTLAALPVAIRARILADVADELMLLPTRRVGCEDAEHD